MSATARTAENAGFVEAELTYCVDTGVKPVNDTRDAIDRVAIYTGSQETRMVAIRDARAGRDDFALDVHGFAFADHDTGVRDFLDADQVRAVYYPEIIALITARTGARRVEIFDHTVRVGDEDFRRQKLLREPVFRVHNDYTDWSGPRRLRDVLPGEAEALLAQRFAIIQVWRPIQSVLKTNPLAVCDARTVKPGNLIATERRYPERIGETYQVTFDAAHQWYYLPDMRRGEAIVFKVYESATDGRARFTPHTSFADPNTPPGAPPRQSIEARALVFFGDD